MGTQSDDHNSENIGDTNSHSQGSSYQESPGDENDSSSSGEKLPLASLGNKKLKRPCPTTTPSPRARDKILVFWVEHFFVL
jgi:hypothetical protein